MDDENITINHQMTGDQVICLNVGDKRVHSRHEGIKIKIMIQGMFRMDECFYNRGLIISSYCAAF